MSSTVTPYVARTRAEVKRRYELTKKTKYTAGARTKGYIQNQVTLEKKAFMFNPSEISFSRSATYSEISSPGMSYPLFQFVKGESTSFGCPLYIYDKPYTGAVKEWLNFLNGFLPPEYTYSKNYSFTKPPYLLIAMGSFVKVCVLESLGTTYTDFNSQLQPTEATFTLSLRRI